MFGCGKKKNNAEIIKTEDDYEISSNSSNVSVNSLSDNKTESDNTADIIEPQGKPAYYNSYAKILLQFMTGQGGYSTDLEAFYYKSEIPDYLPSPSPSQGFCFMLKDVNDDNIDELIVSLGGSGDANLFVPADTWEEAYVGKFYDYDETSNIFRGSNEYNYLDYYILKEGKIEILERYEYEWGDGAIPFEAYYHIDKDGTKTEITLDEYDQNTPKPYENPIPVMQGDWIPLTPTSLELLTDVTIEDLVDINVSLPISVLNYNHRDGSNSQKDYNSITEFIESNGFDVSRPFHKYLNAFECTQMLLYYDETTEIGCVVIDSYPSNDSYVTGYSFVGLDQDENGYGKERFNTLVNEYKAPFDVSNRVDIYSKDQITELKETKTEDKNGNITDYYAVGKIVGQADKGYAETMIYVENTYDQNNMLRHRIFQADGSLYGTSESAKSTCYDENGRATYVDYYLTSGRAYNWYIYPTDGSATIYSLSTEYDMPSLCKY